LLYFRIVVCLSHFLIISRGNRRLRSPPGFFKELYLTQPKLSSQHVLQQIHCTSLQSDQNSSNSKLQIPSAIDPPRSLASKYNSCSPSRFSISCGTGPVRLLSKKERPANAAISPIWVGIFPNSWLEPKSNTSRFVRRPSSFGIVDAIILSKKVRWAEDLGRDAFD
jgi:hypothetical protein